MQAFLSWLCAGFSFMAQVDSLDALRKRVRLRGQKVTHTLVRSLLQPGAAVWLSDRLTLLVLLHWKVGAHKCVWADGFAMETIANHFQAIGPIAASHSPTLSHHSPYLSLSLPSLLRAIASPPLLITITRLHSSSHPPTSTPRSPLLCLARSASVAAASD